MKKKRAEKRRNEAIESKDAGPQDGSLPSQAPGTESVVYSQDETANEEPTTIDAQDERIPNEESDEEKRRRRIYRWKLIIALFPCQFLASVDITIVSTALTTISSHFSMFDPSTCLHPALLTVNLDQLQQFNWIVTAYTLCSTAFIPTYGQIADTYGRHAALQIAMVCMLIGSTLCAAAQTWGMLLLGRALQGVSAAGIANMVKIILADRVTLAEQSKNSTIFSMVTGIGVSVGPLIGGALSVKNWRYCFVISIPIAALAMVLIFVLLRKELIHGTHHVTGPERKSFRSGLLTIDYGGTFLFIFGTGLIILGTSWGGSKYAWTSAQVLAPLVVGSILFVLFFVYEYLLEPGKPMGRVFPRQVAMIPWTLFQKKDAALLAIINAATGASLYSAIYFVGIYWTLAQDLNPQQAGYRLLYYVPGLGLGVYAAMFLCNIFPKQTFYPLFIGTTLEAAGFGVLVYATRQRSSTLVSVMLAVAGGGSGLRLMPCTLHAAGIWRDRIAAVMSMMDFALPFGGTLAIAIMSSVFYNKFASFLVSVNTAGAFSATSHNSTQSLQGIDSLPLNVQHTIREDAAHAVMWSFASILPIMAISVAAASCLGNIWIAPQKLQDNQQSKGAVLYSSYLWALLTVSLLSLPHTS